MSPRDRKKNLIIHNNRVSNLPKKKSKEKIEQLMDKDKEIERVCQWETHKQRIREIQKV